MTLRLDKVSKRFGPIEALRPLDLEIRRHEWVGLFGHNGSGKTTLIRVLVGLLRPSSGRILLDGEPMDRNAWRALRRTLGFMPERIEFYGDLSGEENLEYLARLRELDAATVMPLLERVGLGEAAGRKVCEYSKGMRQRLNLAQALLGSPELLVLDEPIEGLDPRGVRDFFSLLRSGEPRTVVFSSHRLSEVCRHVDRICILVDGAVRALGTLPELFEELDLPVKVHIYPTRAMNGTFDAALAGLGAAVVVRRGEALVAEVAQANKTAFLLGLHAYGEAIRHLHIEEPTLEGAYFDAE